MSGRTDGKAAGVVFVNGVPNGVSAMRLTEAAIASRSMGQALSRQQVTTETTAFTAVDGGGESLRVASRGLLSRLATAAIGHSRKATARSRRVRRKAGSHYALQEDDNND